MPPGGGGVKAAIKGYRIAIKTGTAKKWGRTVATINKYITLHRRRRACESGRASRWWLSSTIRRRVTLRRRRFRAGIWCHHGRRSAHHEHRTGRADKRAKNEFVINQGEEQVADRNLRDLLAPWWLITSAREP